MKHINNNNKPSILQILRRYLAMGVDTLIINLLSPPIGNIASSTINTLLHILGIHLIPATGLKLTTFLCIIIWIILYIKLVPIIIHKHGNSLGKKLFNLEIKTLDNTPLTLEQISTREQRKILLLLPAIILYNLTSFWNHSFAYIYVVYEIISFLCFYMYMSYFTKPYWWDKASNTTVIYKQLNWQVLIAMLTILPLIFTIDYYAYHLINFTKKGL